jgi:hypothetical protein
MMMAFVDKACIYVGKELLLIAYVANIEQYYGKLTI